MSNFFKGLCKLVAKWYRVWLVENTNGISGEDLGWELQQWLRNPEQHGAWTKELNA
jgi:hypothetical protein